MLVHAPVFFLYSGYSRVIPHLSNFSAAHTRRFKWNSEFSAIFHSAYFGFHRGRPLHILSIDSMERHRLSTNGQFQITCEAILSPPQVASPFGQFCTTPAHLGSVITTGFLLSSYPGPGFPDRLEF